MFTKIKEFLFGKDPVQSPVAAPYKVETTESKVEAMPVGTEAVMVAPSAVVPEAIVPAEPVVKPTAAKKPAAAKKPTAAKKPAAAKKPTVVKEAAPKVAKVTRPKKSV